MFMLGTNQYSHHQLQGTTEQLVWSSWWFIALPKDTLIVAVKGRVTLWQSSPHFVATSVLQILKS